MPVFHMCTQHAQFDHLRQPWTLSPDLGAIVAPRPASASDPDQGDGAFVYTWTPSGVRVVPTTTPDRGAEVIRQRDEQRRENARQYQEALAKSQAAYEAARAAALAKAEAQEGMEGTDESEDSVNSEDSSEDRAPERTFKKQRAPKARRRESRNAPEDDHTDVTHLEYATACDAELRAMCRIERNPRPDGSRADLAIYSPDGVRHRSIVAALRHMRGS